MSFEELPLTPREIINQELLLSWAKQAWSSSAMVSVEDFYHQDCVITGMAPVVIEGIDQLRAVYQTLHSRVDHQGAELSFVTIKGDQFAFVLELQGTHRETGKDIVIEVGTYGTMKDGLIYQCHNVVDYSQMYAKLGMLDVSQIPIHFG